jgi:hypothetical protein
MPCVIDMAERDYPKTPLSRVEDSRGILVGAGAPSPATLNQWLDVRHRLKKVSTQLLRRSKYGSTIAG